MQNAQEVTFIISGNLGEAETGGPQMTVIPKSGGNTFSGTALYSGFNDKMQGNNYDDKQLSVLGKYAPALLVRDYQASLGGPIMRDRDVVLLQLPRGGRRRRAARHLRQQERRRRRPSGPTSRTSRGRAAPRTAPQDRVAAPHHADHAQEQADGVLGRAAAVQRRRLERRRPLQLAEGRLDLRRHARPTASSARARTRRRPATTPARTRACGRSSTPAPPPASCCSRPASAPTSRSGATPSGRAIRRRT